MEDPKHPSSDRSPATPAQGDTIALADSRDEDAPLRTSIGDNVGRYVVLETIGHGGMGRVLRAYDPKLQREVALKEVRSRLLGPSGARRLVAEARAMAKLSHPNVVAVYDVEELAQDRVVVVMEYVAGETLATWMRDRPWHEIVACFRRAGRGLAAAHGAGLLHRDFKPDNVLISAIDVVKVTDFGLAKPTAIDHATPDDAGPGSGGDDLTATGVVMGTVRFMAPEQHRGEQLGPSADQYAFCVSLWLALVGKPPFDQRGIDAIERAKTDGPPAWPGGPTPRPIVGAILRGLAPDPAQRWPSMDALLDAIAIDPTSRRRRWVQLAAAIAAVGCTAVAVQAWASARSRRCTEADASAHLEGAWDDARRTEVKDAVLGVGPSYAEGVWTRAEHTLDDYAAAWSRMHVETCEATTVRGEQSTTVMDLRMACLHRATVELNAVTSVLAHADAKTVEKAHDVLAGLLPLERCADVEALREEVEPPLPDDAAVVEAIRMHRAAATAARHVAHYDEAREEIAAAKTLAEGVRYEPARAELLVEEGTLFVRKGDYASAEPALREGLRIALAGRQWEIAQDAAFELAYVLGMRLRRFEESSSYVELARGLAGDDPRRGAWIANHLSMMAAVHGKPQEAEAEARRALAMHEQALGRDDSEVSMSHESLSRALFDLGRYDEAEAEGRRAVELLSSALGRDHPGVASMRNNLAAILQSRGKTAEAEIEYRESLAVRERAFGPDSVDVATGHQNLAIVLNAQGKYAEAEAAVRRALATLPADHPEVALCRNTLAVVLVAQARFPEAEIESRKVVASYEKAFGPEHPDVASVRDVLGVILFKQGKLAEAVVEHRFALAVREKLFGAEHPAVATSLHNLGSALYKQGELVEAETVLRRAVTSREKLLGEDHTILALTRGRLALVLLDRGMIAEARTLAEKAWARRQRDDVPPAERSETALVLARVLRATDSVDDRRRAVELAERALTDAEAAGTAGRVRADEARTWLAEHR